MAPLRRTSDVVSLFLNFLSTLPCVGVALRSVKEDFPVLLLRALSRSRSVKDDCLGREREDASALALAGGGKEWCERDGKGTAAAILLPSVGFAAVERYGERGWLCFEA